MRLLYTSDDDSLACTEDLPNGMLPPYAILSHTWEEGQEVTFSDFKGGNANWKAGWRKIDFCARQAKEDGLRHVWIDTCCIDKSNNTELSEAINSMFRWYQNAQVCYVYLSDVSAISSEDGQTSLRRKPQIRKSRWFTRGWTLQELIAPARIDFFSKEWTRLGDKQSLLLTLQERTGIAARALEGSPTSTFTVGERMLWAKGRETTREEDSAYCLLGIFDVHMPLIYGEGCSEAFERLRKRITERHSISLPIAKGASYNSHAEEHNARCLPNTRTALLYDIADWAKKEDGKLMFWLCGMAGTGKSTIARTAAHSLAQAGQLGASFFFKKGEGERGNASRFFSTIASDLATCEPGMLSGIRKALEEDPDIIDRNLRDQFEKMILQPLADAKQVQSRASMRVVVIDALDECENEDDIRAILQLLARMAGQGCTRLRVLVTSRPELHIRLGFKQMSDGTYQDLVLHEVPRSTIEHDIKYFLEHELGAIRQERSLSPSWPTREQVEALVELTVPLFIFAATVCRYVATKGGDPETYLDKVLRYRKATFSQLDRTYLPVLDQLLVEQEEDDRETWLQDFRYLVGSIVVLESPLSVPSLSALLQIPQRQIECRLDALHSVLSVSSNIDIPVRLLHLSFREFLVDPGQQRKTSFWVDEKITHGKLASRCLELMSASNGLRQNMCNVLHYGVLKSEIETEVIAHSIPAELQYACRYWVEHVEHSQQNISEGGPEHMFLQKHLLHWFEAMSLMGAIDPCIHLLARLQTLGAGVDFLRDARRFLLRFRPVVAEAPLQVYVSSLALAPETSVIRKTFAGQLSKTVEVLLGREADWSACRSVLEGHSDDVDLVAFSPDGQLVVSASDDKTLRLWDTATGTCRSELVGYSHSISAVAFSPDGQLVGAASPKQTIRLWDTATGTCRSKLVGHTGSVNAIAFSPDGRIIISASNDKTVRLWDTATGKCHSKLVGHTSFVNAVAFSPDGQLVASASADKTVRLWDTATGAYCGELVGHTRSAYTVAFSPDGKLIASASFNQTIRVWENATKTCRSNLAGHSGWIIGTKFSPDGQLIASVSSDKTVRLWDTTTGMCRSELAGHSGSVNAVAFSPDGQLVVSASNDKTVRLWDTATGTCRSELVGHSSPVNAVAFSPDGHLIASASDDKTVRLWDTAMCRIETADYSNHASTVKFSPDGQLVASVSKSGIVRLWETATGTCRSEIKGQSDTIQAIFFSPDGLSLLSSSDDDTIRLWDTATGTCSSELVGPVSVAEFSPDGQLAATASTDMKVRLWEMSTGICRSELRGHEKSVYRLAFSPDGQLLASASNDWTVRLWDTATGLCCKKLVGHSGPVDGVAFSRNGRILASASDDKTVRIWDAETGVCCAKLVGHTSFVTAVAFSLDGQLVASASFDKTVRVWKITTGIGHTVLEDHSLSINRLAFSPDGTFLRTNRGDIPLPFSLSLGPPLPPNEQAAQLLLTDQWVLRGGQRYFLLPFQYRTYSTVVHGDLVCLGRGSGRAVLLRFR